jgi:hypothetical protein
MTGSVESSMKSLVATCWFHPHVYVGFSGKRIPTAILQISHNLYRCLHQFTWHLHSTAVIFAWLVTAGFMQWDGKAGITNWITFCVAVFTPLLHAHAAHAVHAKEKHYFERWY